MSLTFEPLTDPDLRVTDLGIVYFIGIGGAGMSVIARMLHAAGVEVHGADSQSNAVTVSLQDLGITVWRGHESDQVKDASTVVVSSAVRESNPELTFARKNGLRILHRSQALALLMRDQRAVAVAGAHGKTSTSAMIAVGAQELGLNPSFAIGGSVISATGTMPGGKLGTGDILIAEADESDGSFLNYAPFIGVITNVEADHLDHYGSEENFEQAFVQFAAQVSGTLVTCADDPGAARIAAAHRAGGGAVITYGQSQDADARIADLVQVPGEVGFTCTVHLAGSMFKTNGHVTLKLGVPGAHNAANATAALVALTLLGAEPQQAAESLTNFLGTGRRFELRGTVGDIRVVDDYAHHPTEVEALLTAARITAGTGRVLTLFQPHLYSRTKSFAAEFANALSASDVTVLTSIYPAREDFDPSITSQHVAQLMTSAVAVEPIGLEAAHKIAQLARPGDLILTVGAGDVTLLGAEVLKELDALASKKAQE